MKAVIQTKEGIQLLTWMLEQIANADVPYAVRPLLFDNKRVALHSCVGNEAAEEGGRMRGPCEHESRSLGA